MSKKHRKHSSEDAEKLGSPSVSASLTEEYRIIRSDLITVVGLNIVYLAAVLLLYYTNQESHYLERWFTNIFHF